MHILKKTLIFSVLICSLGLNAHSAVDDDLTFTYDHLRLIFTPQAYSNLAYHTLDGVDTNEPTAHVLTLRIDNPVRTTADQENVITALFLASAQDLVESKPYFNLSHIVNQLINYREDSLYDTTSRSITNRYFTDWLRSASLHADVPAAIKERILAIIGPVPLIVEPTPGPSAAD